MLYLVSAAAQGTFESNLSSRQAEPMRTIRFPVYTEPECFDQAVALLRM